MRQLRSAPCAASAPRAARRAAPRIHIRASAAVVTKDATAEILQAAVAFSLRQRLREYDSIRAEVGRGHLWRPRDANHLRSFCPVCLRGTPSGADGAAPL